MNGAECLLRTLAACGVEVCFTNPGTSEIDFVAAADRVDGLRFVLGLFEGVCSGAADGYGRMAGKPAATLLHLGPGLANALANFHNARRARTPTVNLVGDHASYHLSADPPLASDVAGLAAAVSGWVRTAADAKSLAADGAAAVAAALGPPGQIATLIVPADFCWQDGDRAAVLPAAAERRQVSPEALRSAADALRSGEPTVLLMTGGVLSEEGLALASRAAGTAGARLVCNTFNARLQRGAGRPVIERLPYFPEDIAEALEGTKHLVLVGTEEPVAFFAYPGKPSRLTPEGCRVHALARPEDDGVAALEALVDELGAPPDSATLQPFARPERPHGELSAETIAAALGALLPEGAIVSDESNTEGFGLMPATAGAPPHDWLALTGGAIGQGLPVATGAALACPGRKVVCLQADGSAMYTLQALWTQAREGLDVTTVLYSNRQYRILQMELLRSGAEEPGPAARAVLDLGRPDLDWVNLASGLGVEGTRATTSDDFYHQLARAMNEPGPHLIEAVL